MPPTLLKDISSPYIRLCGYGGTGVGKTIWALGSQVYRTFHFDVDDGVVSARNWRGDPTQNLKPSRSDLVTWSIRNRLDFDEAFRYLTANVKHFQVCVVDTHSELQRLILHEIQEKSNHQVADTRDWGLVLTAMETITKAFKSLPMHVIHVCHEQFYTDEQLQRNIWRPNYRGQFAIEYAKHYSYVARYCLIDQQVKSQNGQLEQRTIRAFNCERDAVTDAKNRGGLSKWEPPNLDAMLSKIMAANQVVTVATT